MEEATVGTNLYQLSLVVELPKEETDQIMSMEHETMKQMGVRGILELIYRGEFKISALDIAALPTPENTTEDPVAE